MRGKYEHERKHQRVSINVTGDMVLSSCIDVINISLGGAMVECDQRLDLGKTLKILVTLDDKKLLLEGSVIHSSIVRSDVNKKGESVPIYKAGIRFDHDLTGEEKKIIESLNE
jgi:hypothetical protein